MKFRQRFMSKMMKRMIFSVLFLLCLGVVGWASTPEIPLLLEGNKLTGHLSQVTLRSVLEQLHKQLGIKYEAPAAELDKIISVNLQQTPLLPALAKILAPWDYAFTMNSAGRLQFLYITTKAPPSELESVTKTLNRSDDLSSDTSGEMGVSPQKGGSVQVPEDADPFPVREPEHDRVLPPSSSSHASQSEEMPGLSAPLTGVPMAIQPVPAGTTMPIVPSMGGSGMQVKPAANPPNMPIIPATAYPPMDIQPVPDYLQEEMLRNIQP